MHKYNDTARVFAAQTVWKCFDWEADGVVEGLRPDDEYAAGDGALFAEAGVCGYLPEDVI